jgi:hypothetical protein
VRKSLAPSCAQVGRQAAIESQIHNFIGNC